MKKILEKKSWVIAIAILLIITLPFLTNILGLISTPITQGNTESWISFFGSYFGGTVGGILGALIAFGIAKYQIDEQRENNRKELFIKQLPTLIKIRLEIDGINSNFNSIKAIFIDQNNAPFPIDITAQMALPEFNFVGIEELSNLLNSELQADLIKLKYFHNDLVKVFAFDTSKNDIQLQMAFSEHERLNRKKNRSKTEELKIRELIDEVKDLHLKREATLANKQFYLDELNKNIKLTERLKILVEQTYQKALELSSDYDLMRN